MMKIFSLANDLIGDVKDGHSATIRIDSAKMK